MGVAQVDRQTARLVLTVTRQAVAMAQLLDRKGPAWETMEGGRRGGGEEEEGDEGEEGWVCQHVDVLWDQGACREAGVYKRGDRGVGT